MCKKGHSDLLLDVQRQSTHITQSYLVVLQRESFINSKGVNFWQQQQEPRATTFHGKIFPFAICMRENPGGEGRKRIQVILRRKSIRILRSYNTNTVVLAVMKN